MRRNCYIGFIKAEQSRFGFGQHDDLTTRQAYDDSNFNILPEQAKK